MCFVGSADFGLEAMERQLIHALCYYADRSGQFLRVSYSAVEQLLKNDFSTKTFLNLPLFHKEKAFSPEAKPVSELLRISWQNGTPSETIFILFRFLSSGVLSMTSPNEFQQLGRDIDSIPGKP